MSRAAGLLVAAALLAACEVTINAGRDVRLRAEPILENPDPQNEAAEDSSCSTLAAATGETAPCTLHIANHSSDALSLAGWAVNDGGGVFSVLTAPQMPTLLQPEEVAAFELQASFARVGLVRSALVVTSDAPAPQSFRFPLLAFGLEPTAALVQLTWSTASGNFDLHLIRADGSGRFCASGGAGAQADTQAVAGLATTCPGTVDEDCSWSNCASDPALDWDGSGGPSAGDPVVVISDSDGEGPEMITIPAVTAGRYLVAIHRALAPATPAELRVRVLARDGVAAEVTATERGWWEAGVLEVGDTSCFHAPTASGCP